MAFVLYEQMSLKSTDVQMSHHLILFIICLFLKWQWKSGDVCRLHRLEARSHESTHRRQKSHRNVVIKSSMTEAIWAEISVSEYPYLGRALLTYSFWEGARKGVSNIVCQPQAG